MPVYLYWGEEEFNLNLAVNELRNKVINPEWASLTHKVFNEPDFNILLEALRTPPLFGGNVLVEVKSSNLFLRGSKKTFTPEMTNRLIEAIETLNENIHALFICEIPRDSGKKIDSVLKLVKFLQSSGKVEQFDQYKQYQEKEISIWIKQRADKIKVKINPDAVLLLAQNSGADLRKIDTELEKLKTAVYPENIIFAKHVLTMCSSHENVFSLADYWLKGDKNKALLELGKLLEKDHPIRILATLQTIVRKWLKVKVESRTKTAFEISKILNANKFIIEKDMQKLKNIELNTIFNIKNKLTEYEYKIKKGDLPPELALELAINS